MSEHESAPEAQQTPAPAGDELKNLKAEFNRKLENQNAQMQQLLNSLNKPAPSIEPKKVSVFEDEDAYARMIEERAEKRIEEKLARQAASQSKFQQVVNQISQEYPEANDTSSELYKRAQEHYSSLGEDEKSSPLALKASVASAASELGLKPKSKRTSSSEYVSSSSSSSSSRRKDELDSSTADFARMMGLNMDDQKVRDSLKNRKVNIRR